MSRTPLSRRSDIGNIIWSTQKWLASRARNGERQISKKFGRYTAPLNNAAAHENLSCLPHLRHKIGSVRLFTSEVAALSAVVHPACGIRWRRITGFLSKPMAAMFLGTFFHSVTALTVATTLRKDAIPSSGWCRGLVNAKQRRNFERSKSTSPASNPNLNPCEDASTLPPGIKRNRFRQNKRFLKVCHSRDLTLRQTLKTMSKEKRPSLRSGGERSGRRGYCCRSR